MKLGISAYEFTLDAFLEIHLFILRNGGNTGASQSSLFSVAA